MIYGNESKILIQNDFWNRLHFPQAVFFFFRFSQPVVVVEFILGGLGLDVEDWPSCALFGFFRPHQRPGHAGLGKIRIFRPKWLYKENT